MGAQESSVAKEELPPSYESLTREKIRQEREQERERREEEEYKKEQKKRELERYETETEIKDYVDGKFKELLETKLSLILYMIDSMKRSSRSKEDLEEAIRKNEIFMHERVFILPRQMKYIWERLVLLGFDFDVKPENVIGPSSFWYQIEKATTFQELEQRVRQITTLSVGRPEEFLFVIHFYLNPESRLFRNRGF